MSLRSFFCLFFLSAASASAQVPVAGLQAYYPFNGNANDSTGHALNDGKLFLTNPTPFVTDRSGSGLAANFDGVDDYILIPNKSSFNMPRDSAVIFSWFNASVCGKTVTGARDIWDTYELSNTGKRREMWLSATAMKDSLGNSFQQLEAVAIVSNNTDTELMVLPFQVHNDGWHSTGVVWEKPILKLYVDGAWAGTKTASIPDAKMSTNNKTTLFGSDVFTAKQCFCGLIDDLRLYNRVLSDSEMTLLAKEGIERVLLPTKGTQPSFYTVIVKNSLRGNYTPVVVLVPSFSWPPVSIALFTVDGRRVANLFWRMKNAGTAECFLDKSGSILHKGVYILKAFSANGSGVAVPVTLLK